MLEPITIFWGPSNTAVKNIDANTSPSSRGQPEALVQLLPTKGSLSEVEHPKRQLNALKAPTATSNISRQIIMHIPDICSDCATRIHDTNQGCWSGITALCLLPYKAVVIHADVACDFSFVSCSTAIEMLVYESQVFVMIVYQSTAVAVQLQERWCKITVGWWSSRGLQLT